MNLAPKTIIHIAISVFFFVFFIKIKIMYYLKYSKEFFSIFIDHDQFCA